MNILRNRKGSGVDVVVAGVFVFTLVMSMVVYFISVIYFYSLDNAIQVEVQQAGTLISKNGQLTQGIDTFLRTRISKFNSTAGPFRIIYLVQQVNPSTGAITAVGTYGDGYSSIPASGVNLSRGMLVRITAIQQNNSLLGRVSNLVTGTSKQIKITVTKEVAVETW